MGALGIAPGPEVGRLLAAVEDAAGAGEVSSREEAIELARRLRAGSARALLRPAVTRRPERALIAAGDA
jgi:hypothetical protein